jgi:hypothetical protein
MSNPIPDPENPRPTSNLPQPAPTSALLGVESRIQAPPKVHVGPESSLHTGLNVLPFVGPPGVGASAPAVPAVIAAFRPGVNPLPVVLPAVSEAVDASLDEVASSRTSADATSST